jgi:hypothetical protein
MVCLMDLILYKTLDFNNVLERLMDWDSIVGIVTCNGLHGLGFESWWGVRFYTPIQTGRGVHPACCTMGIGSLS